MHSSLLFGKKAKTVCKHLSPQTVMPLVSYDRYLRGQQERLSRQQYAFFMQHMDCPFADRAVPLESVASPFVEDPNEAKVTRPNNAIFVNIIHL